MDTFWGLTGFLPVLVYGLLLYWLLVVVPRWFKSKRTRKAPQTPSNQPVSAAPPTPSDAVSETVSVILRRQVPPRFDEAARSWLGGLPCMPEGIEWPRSISYEHPEQGERPLHFLAQICCADLPAELWGGLGPREGWLLLFIDPNQGSPDGNDAFQILHVAELGAERPAPFDLGPVHDGVYTGYRYGHLRPGEKVPNVWRRWPVDLVAVANEAREQHGRVLASPDNFASLLYPDQTVADDRYTRSDPEREPMTDMYVDAGKRSLIPADALLKYEPQWRQLRDNRPHRMGGYHDGLQSDATIGPATELLLFQIASDDAMQWCWGDVGACYFWIRPKHLASGDFSGVRMDLECH